MRRFLPVVEVGAIALAANLLGAAGLTPLVPPVIAPMVGLHFLPLAAIFGVGLYYLTGAVIASVAAAAIVAPLFGVTLGGPFGRSVAVGLVTAAILWTTAFLLLRDVADRLRSDARAR